MCSALHKVFTLKNMISLAVLDAQMNLSLSPSTHSLQWVSEVVQHLYYFLVYERSLPCSHRRRERGTECKRSWNGNAHASSYGSCGERAAIRGRQLSASWGCGETHREAPSARTPWCSKWHQSHDCCSTKDRREVFVAEQRCSYRWVPFLDLPLHICVWLLSSSVMTCARTDHVARDL